MDMKTLAMRYQQSTDTPIIQMIICQCFYIKPVSLSVVRFLASFSYTEPRLLYSCISDHEAGYRGEEGGISPGAF